MLLAERAESERLRQIIKELQRHRFGRRAESLPQEQLQFALEEAEQIEAAGLAKTESPVESKARAAKRRANRGALPVHLPRIETVVDVTSTICPGCSGTLHRIGEDVCERLDIVPAQFRVLVVRRSRPASSSTISCLGLIPRRRNSGPWPEDDAYGGGTRRASSC